MESAINKLKPKLGEENYQKLNKISSPSLPRIHLEIC